MSKLAQNRNMSHAIITPPPSQETTPELDQSNHPRRHRVEMFSPGNDWDIQIRNRANELGLAGLGIAVLDPIRDSIMEDATQARRAEMKRINLEQFTKQEHGRKSEPPTKLTKLHLAKCEGPCCRETAEDKPRRRKRERKEKRKTEHPQTIKLEGDKKDEEEDEVHHSGHVASNHNKNQIRNENSNENRNEDSSAENMAHQKRTQRHRRKKTTTNEELQSPADFSASASDCREALRFAERQRLETLSPVEEHQRPVVEEAIWYRGNRNSEAPESLNLEALGALEVPEAREGSSRDQRALSKKRTRELEEVAPGAGSNQVHHREPRERRKQKSEKRTEREREGREERKERENVNEEQQTEEQEERHTRRPVLSKESLRARRTERAARTERRLARKVSRHDSQETQAQTPEREARREERQEREAKQAAREEREAHRQARRQEREATRHAERLSRLLESETQSRPENCQHTTTTAIQVQTGIPQNQSVPPYVRLEVQSRPDAQRRHTNTHSRSITSAQERSLRSVRAAERDRQRVLMMSRMETPNDNSQPPRDEYTTVDEDIPPYRPQLHKYLDLMSYDERFAPVLRVNRYLVSGEQELSEAIHKFTQFNLLPQQTNLWSISHVDDNDYERMIPVLIPELLYFANELQQF